jgi:hypothetical protein
MPSLKKIICLANSWKLNERCIAGIDLDTGKWIRPVCDSLYPEDGRIPRRVRLVESREPELLDILAIPLADSGNDFGFASENLSVSPGQWKYLGKAEPLDLLRHCDRFPQILHNSIRYVKPSYLLSLPLYQRRTLELIEVRYFSVEQTKNSGWRGSIKSDNGCRLEKVKITDPVLIDKLDAGYKPPNNCLITFSLSMPWKPPDWEEETEAPCWKLIASVIEIQAKMSNNSLTFFPLPF